MKEFRSSKITVVQELDKTSVKILLLSHPPFNFHILPTSIRPLSNIQKLFQSVPIL
jgi:hypothetical protein